MKIWRVVFTVVSLALMGCGVQPNVSRSTIIARAIGRLGLNIIQPVKVGSGGLPPFDDPVPAPLTPAQIYALDVALADLTPTACDPSDEDGDPYDDDCGPAAPNPTKPQR